MYNNLKAQMAINNVSIEKIADLLKLHRNTIANKLNGGTFSVEEAFIIKQNFFKEFDLYYLFNKADGARSPDKSA
jgi:transcriptional regulator with XRE-family HTH domain